MLPQCRFQLKSVPLSNKYIHTMLMFFMYIAQLYFQEAERALLHCLL